METLRQHPEGVRTAPLTYHKYAAGGFATPSGKVEFASERLRQAGLQAVPFEDGRLDNPISFARQSAAYPLIGISGPRTSCLTHSQFHHIAALLEEEAGAAVDLQPADAKALGIDSGDLVEVASPRGRLTMPARISQLVKAGTVQIAWGWGETEPAANINNLTDDDHRNAVTGTPANRSFMCQVRKIGD